MNDYQKEQWDALSLIMSQVRSLGSAQRQLLLERIASYLDFRLQVDRFLSAHFADHCTRNCYQNRLSACCGKDGIITFWADVVVNVLVTGENRLNDLFKALLHPFSVYKCTYLGPEGCRWQVRPLMCALFLCDQAQVKVFSADKRAADRWEQLTAAAKGYRWPDRPVLFDWLEIYFMDLGCRSPLMYINTSPGLMRVKQMAFTRMDGP